MAQAVTSAVSVAAPSAMDFPKDVAKVAVVARMMNSTDIEARTNKLYERLHKKLDRRHALQDAVEAYKLKAKLDQQLPETQAHKAVPTDEEASDELETEIAETKQLLDNSMSAPAVAE